MIRAPVHSRRFGAAVALLLVAPTATGCLSGASLSLKRELVVDFAPGYQQNQAVHDAVRKACSGLPGVLTETPGPGSIAVYDVRFDITHASTRQLNRLYTCLSTQPGVEGAHTEGGSLSQ
ncbi:MAG: hypothetical protein ACYDB7_12745 [Mycobacteriales bacterium]